jgi:hypothetical protein
MRWLAIVCFVLAVVCVLSETADARSSGIYSVCENCVIVKAEGQYFIPYSQDDDTIYAKMQYSPIAVNPTKDGQNIRMDLSSYQCLEKWACNKDLTRPVDLTIRHGTDPLKGGPNSVNVDLKMAGISYDKTCGLSEAVDPSSSRGFSFKTGVNFYCRMTMPDRSVFSLSLEFKRIQ